MKNKQVVNMRVPLCPNTPDDSSTRCYGGRVPEPIRSQSLDALLQLGSAYIHAPPDSVTSDYEVLPGDSISIHMRVPPNTPTGIGDVTVREEDSVSIHLNLNSLDVNDLNEQNKHYHRRGHCHHHDHHGYFRCNHHHHRHDHDDEDDRGHLDCQHHDGDTDEEDIDSNETDSQYVPSDGKSDSAKPASVIRSRIQRPLSILTYIDRAAATKPQRRCPLNATAAVRNPPVNDSSYRRSQLRPYTSVVCEGIPRPAHSPHAPLAYPYNDEAVEVVGTPVCEPPSTDRKLSLRSYQDLYDELKKEMEDIYGYDRGDGNDCIVNKAKSSIEGSSKEDTKYSTDDSNGLGKERPFESQLKIIEELEEMRLKTSRFAKRDRRKPMTFLGNRKMHLEGLSQ